MYSFPNLILVLHLDCSFMSFDIIALSSNVFFPTPGKKVSEEPLKKTHIKSGHTWMKALQLCSKQKLV